VISNILKEYTAFVFFMDLYSPWRWKWCIPSKCQEPLIHHCTLTSQKTNDLDMSWHLMWVRWYCPFSHLMWRICICLIP